MSKLHAACQQVLNETAALTAQLQTAHWNATGALFHAIHEQTEAQYEDLFEAQDMIAERLRALGANVTLTLSQAAVPAVLPEMSGEEMLKTLVAGHEAVLGALKTAAEVADDEDDDGTEDAMIERIRAHDKFAWLLKSNL